MPPRSVRLCPSLARQRPLSDPRGHRGHVLPLWTWHDNEGAYWAVPKHLVIHAEQPVGQPRTGAADHQSDMVNLSLETRTGAALGQAEALT
jgi:hypothetical protein